MNIDETLDATERALAEGRGLEGTGFWKAVAACRRDAELARIHADRIAVLDRTAFERGVKLRVPLATGLAVLVLGIAVGAALLVGSARLEEPWRSLSFLAGFGAVLVCTHSPAHWLVGRLVGMRFTHVFLGGPPPPRPGVKTDYATYLRTPAKRRALMHASGAVVTKIVPFALVPAALAVETWTGVVWILVGLGVVQILTDALLSTKVSDWKKVRRELRAAASG